LKTGRIYRLTHQAYDPTDDIQEVVDISDMDYLIDDADTTEIVTVQGGPSPVRCAVIDNDEDPFTPVKGQQLTIQILTDNPISMNTFASGSDQRWLVHHYIGADTLFKGYLVLDDIEVDFMPDPNVLILTATDGLGTLRDVPLTDANDENPVGEYKIIELLKMALDKTGLSLGIKAAFNIKNEGFIDDISIPNANNQHFFSINYLNAKTFEDQIGTCVSCREVIEYILGEEAQISQFQGKWFIKRVDEVEQNRGLYISEWDADGDFVGNLGEKDFNNDIGKDSPYTIFFSRESTKVIPTRPHKSVKCTFDYNYPLEIVENIDFDRGDLILDSGVTKTYELDDWVPLFSNTSTDDLPTASIYTRRTFEDGYEKDRYVVIEASSDFHFIMSQPIRVGVKDKFTLGLERRLSADIGGSGFVRENHIQVRLYADDGTYYTHKSRTSASEEKRWVACTSTFRTNQNHFAIEYDLASDLTEAVGLFDGESAEIPKAGYIRILLYASADYGDTVATYFSGISFDYKPFINGSYGKFTGQYQKVSQSGNYKAKRERSVMISESPRMLMKGTLVQGLIYNTVFSGSVTFTTSTSFKIAGYQLSLFRKGQRLNISGTTSNNITETRVTEVEYSIIGSETIIHIEATTTTETDASTLVQELTYQIADEFYNAATQPDGPIDSTYIHPYSEIQVYDVWNQFMYDKRVFQATLQGLDLAATDGDGNLDNAHLAHKWFLQDATDDTYNREFQLLTFDQDHRTGEWTGTFREVFNFDREKSYTGREFRYIQ
jgi:hypothetical protein